MSHPLVFLRRVPAATLDGVPGKGGGFFPWSRSSPCKPPRMQYEDGRDLVDIALDSTRAVFRVPSPCTTRRSGEGSGNFPFMMACAACKACAGVIARGR